LAADLFCVLILGAARSNIPDGLIIESSAEVANMTHRVRNTGEPTVSPGETWGESPGILLSEEHFQFEPVS
jgi:hypothetical protein